MKSIVPALCLILCLALAASAADEFFLKSGDGNEYGPFEYLEGKTIQVENRKYRIKKDLPDALRVMEILETIIIPEVDFRCANIYDVLTFFNEQIHQHDKKLDISILLNLGRTSETVSPGPTGDDPFAPAFPTDPPPPAPDDPFAAIPSVRDVPVITFCARQISVAEALRIVTEVAGLKYRVQGKVVMVVPENAPEGDLVVRMYNVLPTVFERAAAIGSLTKPPEQDSAMKEFFADLGVRWPMGSQLSYVESIGQLVVANTTSNLENFEKVLSVLNVVPTQVEVELEYVEFDTADIEALSKQGMVERDDLLALWKQGKGKLLANPRTVTQAGVEVAVRSVRECIYPTEFDVGVSISTNAAGGERPPGLAVTPGAFETRETGVILAVGPDVSPDGKLITLTMQPELVFEPVWKDYGGDYVDPEGQKRHVKMEQPFFHTHRCATSLSSYNGETLLVGGGLRSRDPGKMIYTFVTTQLVGCDGEPVRRETIAAKRNPERPRFFLLDETAREFGPFLFAQGSQVELDRGDYTVSKIVTERERTIALMKQIVIPEIDFRQASIDDIVDFLHEQSVELDPKKRGVNIMADLQDFPVAAPPSPFDVSADPFADPPPAPPADPLADPEAGGKPLSGPVPVTFNARYISLYEALKIVAEVSNMKLRIEGDRVSLVSKLAPDGPIVVRLYDVLPTIEHRLRAVIPEQRGGDFAPAALGVEESEWKRFFRQMGVQWPEGSSVRYIRSIGKLVVANTEENLAVFENVLSILNVMPTQIEVEMHVVQFDRGELEAATRKAKLTTETLAALRKQGKGRLINAPRIVTQAGAEAAVRGVTEYIHPTGFSLEHVVDTNTTPESVVIASLAEPWGFETREVGGILQVMPEVSPDGKMLTLTLHVEEVGSPDWRDYGGEFIDSQGRAQKACMPSPFFRNQRVSTSVSLYNGATAVFGGGPDAQDATAITYMFVTARLVDPAGKPLTGTTEAAIKALVPVEEK